MTVSTSKVAIVLPVHNRRDTTLQALRSLARIDRTGIDVHIIVVDDGSTDGTSDAIRREFANVQLISGDGSLHYAAGTNRGITAALLHGVDYVVTCNDDSIFHEDFLRQMLATARARPRTIVGALLLRWDKPDRVFQVGFRWKTLRGGWTQSDDVSAFDLSRESFEVEGLAGNCVLIPVDAIRECGLMDEKHFPHGWGDIQYFARMRKAGWQLLVDPRAYVWCEPNTNPPPLHTLPVRKILRVLFSERRHPLNLQRQFVARWESAPGPVSAIAAYGAYIIFLFCNAATKLAGRKQHS
jgi:GT2 family glycosyltransferase